MTKKVICERCGKPLRYNSKYPDRKVHVKCMTLDEKLKEKYGNTNFRIRIVDLGTHYAHGTYSPIYTKTLERLAQSVLVLIARLGWVTGWFDVSGENDETKTFNAYLTLLLRLIYALKPENQKLLCETIQKHGEEHHELFRKIVIYDEFPEELIEEVES